MCKLVQMVTTYVSCLKKKKAKIGGVYYTNLEPGLSQQLGYSQNGNRTLREEPAHPQDPGGGITQATPLTPTSY